MPRSAQPELLQGTLDLLILAALREGPAHGYGLARAIERRSARALCIEEGSLYPALHRLARAGALAGEWRLNDTGRRARFYRLTSAGHARLEQQAALWERLSGGVNRVLAGSA